MWQIKQVQARQMNGISYAYAFARSHSSSRIVGRASCVCQWRCHPVLRLSCAESGPAAGRRFNRVAVPLAKTGCPTDRSRKPEVAMNLIRFEGHASIFRHWRCHSIWRARCGQSDMRLEAALIAGSATDEGPMPAPRTCFRRFRLNRRYCRMVLECGGGDTAFECRSPSEAPITFGTLAPFESGVAPAERDCRRSPGRFAPYREISLAAWSVPMRRVWLRRTTITISVQGLDAPADQINFKVQIR